MIMLMDCLSVPIAEEATWIGRSSDKMPARAFDQCIQRSMLDSPQARRLLALR